MITYYDLGPDKKLNEIVMAGSHDAGITFGGSNTQTQDLDIYGQATAGVRVFDLRITGAVLKKGETDVLALKTYHGQGPSSKTTGIDVRTGQTGTVKTKSMWAGEYGMGLARILSDSVKFVTNSPSEFLILKFDKCHNWLMIAKACVEILANHIYKGGGNLNTKTLRELQGKVIVVFTKDGIEAVHHLYGIPQGILGIKNLYKSDSVYDVGYHGLQYFGKGGTSVSNPFKSYDDKVKENMKKQTKIMKQGGDGNAQVMGMMYWTTTGVTQSIRDRNTRMWTAPNVAKLQNMWEGGLNNAIMSRVNAFASIDGFAGGQMIKAFMPNIIMIDFADAEKCQDIFELNIVPVTFIVNALGDYAHA